MHLMRRRCHPAYPMKVISPKVATSVYPNSDYYSRVVECRKGSWWREERKSKEVHILRIGYVTSELVLSTGQEKERVKQRADVAWR
jgi:hypothetical protein